MDRRTFLRGMILAGVAGAGAGMAAACAPEPQRSIASGTALVIGAGAAGLAAAQRLVAAGQTVTVLEARDRIGGRVWSSDALGQPIDLGASWIHGTTDNPLVPLARAVQARFLATSFDRFGTFDPDGRRLRWAEEEPLWTRWEALLGAALRIDPEAELSVAEALASAAQDMGPPPDGVDAIDLDGYLRWAGALEIGADHAAELDELGVGTLHDGTVLDGPWVMIRGGYRSIFAPVAAALDVRLGQVVTTIEVLADGVTVTTEDGGRHVADRVVVTLPLGVLQAGTVRFAPPLPEATSAAIERLAMGAFLKVVLRFPVRTWPSGVDWLGRIGEPTFREFVDLEPLTDAPTVVGFATGSEARRLETLADGAIVDEAMIAYRAAVGSVLGAMPDPTDALVTRWGADPFARGAYSYLPIGATGADRRALSVPVGTRLALAGEATHERYPSTVHGAWLSGIAAAEGLLDGA